LELYPCEEFHIQLSPRGSLNVFLTSLRFAEDALHWTLENLVPLEGGLRLSFKCYNFLLQALRQLQPFAAVVELQATKLLAVILEAVDEAEGDEKRLRHIMVQLLADSIFLSVRGWSLFAWCLGLSPTREVIEALRSGQRSVESSAALLLRLWDSLEGDLGERDLQCLCNVATSLSEDEKRYASMVFREALLCGFRYAWFKSS
jgi:hypothetical protein